MKCAHCGEEISFARVNFFYPDGTDSYRSLQFEELQEYDCVSITFRAGETWTGYDVYDEQDTEEARKTICCPICKEYPFYSNEIAVEELTEIVCWGIKERCIENIEDEDKEV